MLLTVSQCVTILHVFGKVMLLTVSQCVTILHVFGTVMLLTVSQCVTILHVFGTVMLLTVSQCVTILHVFGTVMLLTVSQCVTILHVFSTVMLLTVSQCVAILYVFSTVMLKFFFVFSLLLHTLCISLFQPKDASKCQTFLILSPSGSSQLSATTGDLVMIQSTDQRYTLVPGQDYVKAYHSDAVDNPYLFSMDQLNDNT